MHYSFRTFENWMSEGETIFLKIFTFIFRLIQKGDAILIQYEEVHCGVHLLQNTSELIIHKNMKNKWSSINGI